MNLSPVFTNISTKRDRERDPQDLAEQDMRIKLVKIMQEAPAPLGDERTKPHLITLIIGLIISYDLLMIVK